MATYTSAEAAKLLKAIEEEIKELRNEEERVATFNAAVEEDPESVRPEYSYTETQEKIDSLTARLRKVKHAINVFNTTQVIPEFDITIDEMLVLIPQLTAKKKKLAGMAARLPKQRAESRGYSEPKFIDYTYANYDVKMVKEDLKKAAAELSRAQLALDKVNTTVSFEIPD
ncbi:MAG: hypothetical protein IJ821_06200 [Lachnospiraceae bacterium]|nr:hypothetical protein [Lachnospiraceae bacterium]